MSENAPEQSENTEALRLTLKAQGAAKWDAVGWHYIETLAERTLAQSGPAQALLNQKLNQALASFKTRMQAAPRPSTLPTNARPSPLSALLKDMRPPLASETANKGSGWRAESPRIRQFRQQLRKISVQKQVSHAIARAPQNAGPINSHMLVLRSLGMMRELSPDYLNRFMTHVDTLLVLEAAGQAKAVTRKNAPQKK